MRIGLFFQAGNFVGREYFRVLKNRGYDVTPITMGVMSNESKGREMDRTGGLWTPPPVESSVDFTEWGESYIQAMARFDVCVNGGVGMRITDSILRAPVKGWINIHPGRLPAFRGSSCPEWAYLLVDEVYATAHFMDGGIDTGPVICTERYPIDPAWDYQRFRANLYPFCATVLIKALTLINQPPTPQVGFGTTWPRMPEQILDLVKRKFAQ